MVSPLYFDTRLLNALISDLKVPRSRVPHETQTLKSNPSAEWTSRAPRGTALRAPGSRLAKESVLSSLGLTATHRKFREDHAGGSTGPRPAEPDARTREDVEQGRTRDTDACPRGRTRRVFFFLKIVTNEKMKESKQTARPHGATDSASE